MPSFDLENRVDAFPEASWKMAREDMAVAQRNLQRTTKFSWAHAMMYTYSDQSYGFRNCLRTGNFAPYDHERLEQNISGLNCTTVIPGMFMRSHIAGLEPRIVQFIDFTNIDPKDPKEDREKMESHFALIVNAGRKKEYLIDPFHSVFGPILNDDGKQMRIGKVGKYRAIRRTYGQIVNYTPQQFDAMMLRMHEPAASLEMLEAGQKIWQGRTVLQSYGSVMIYYDQDKNIVTTRFYIPQVAIRPKIIYCHQRLDEKGELVERELELYNVKTAHWRGLQEGRRLGSFTLGFFEGLQNRIREHVPRRHRIGPAALAHPEFAAQLADYVTSAFDSLSPAEQKELRKMLLVRALYETERPDQQYLFTEEERTNYLKRMLKQIYDLGDEKKPISRREYVHKVKLAKLPSSEVRDLRRDEQRLEREIKEKDDKFVELLNLRNRLKPGFYRTMDKVLYAQQVENDSMEALEKRLKRRDASILLGYAATVADFVPYVRNTREDLSLQDVMHVIKEKVKAKYEQRTTPAALSVTAPELALPVQAMSGG